MVAPVPWCPAPELTLDARRDVRRRAIFDFYKWDQQVGDNATLAGFPILLKREEWGQLSQAAERLAAEAMEAERELLDRPDLHRRLGLSWSLRRALKRILRDGAPRGAGRIMRFDFHFTSDGWRISEVNSDVPGGINESSGYPALLAAHYPDCVSVGDTAAIYADALAASVLPGAVVALVHATAYTDDRQVMAYVAKRLEERGCRTFLASPADLAWSAGRASMRRREGLQPVDLIVRFFPAEWLPNLERASGWRNFFSGDATPMSNPATAVLTQTKRFPLVWDELGTTLDAWREFLPACADPTSVDWESDPAWVVKPALGRVGDGIGLRELIGASEWKNVRRSARRWPRYWVAQRRFNAVPMQFEGDAWYPCIGVYTVDGRVAGAYGRVASRPLIDQYARDAAVFMKAGP